MKIFELSKQIKKIKNIALDFDRQKNTYSIHS